MHAASVAAGCAEMQKTRKMGHLIDFGETGDSPDTLIFYFRHNKTVSITTAQDRKTAARSVSDGLKNVTMMSDRHFYGLWVFFLKMKAQYNRTVKTGH
ncbi:MAG: hypothetical protein FWC50_14290 [Planctomycetaceae bacterium]|nr:hypothetical protein [Planctomycetaceae bacterium]